MYAQKSQTAPGEFSDRPWRWRCTGARQRATKPTDFFVPIEPCRRRERYGWTKEFVIFLLENSGGFFLRKTETFESTRRLFASRSLWPAITSSRRPPPGRKLYVTPPTPVRATADKRIPQNVFLSEIAYGLKPDYF